MFGFIYGGSADPLLERYEAAQERPPLAAVNARMARRKARRRPTPQPRLSLADTETALRLALESESEFEVERWSLAAETHPERLKRDATLRAAWLKEELPRAAEALSLTRSFVPPGVEPSPVARRLARHRALKLVRTHPDDISKLHPADLEGKYVTHGLDVVEIRAVWLASREATFAEPRKARWFAALERRLRELSEGETRGHLEPKDERNPAYPSGRGPFDDAPPPRAAPPTVAQHADGPQTPTFRGYPRKSRGAARSASVPAHPGLAHHRAARRPGADLADFLEANGLDTWVAPVSAMAKRIDDLKFMTPDDVLDILRQDPLLTQRDALKFISLLDTLQ